MKLYLHPLSSYCMKALIALYETDIPFEPVHVDLGSESGDALRKLWPIGKFPLLEDKDNHVIDALRYACEGARRAAKVAPKREFKTMPDADSGGWMS